MDGIAAPLDEIDERIAVCTEQPLGLAIDAKLLEPEAVRRMGCLPAVIVGIRLLEILDVSFVILVPDRQERLDRAFDQAAQIRSRQDQFGRGERIGGVANPQP
jgi:hypothetical protein